MRVPQNLFQAVWESCFHPNRITSESAGSPDSHLDPVQLSGVWKFTPVLQVIVTNIVFDTAEQYTAAIFCTFPSVLWHYWLGNRKGNWPIKTDYVGDNILTRALHIL